MACLPCTVMEPVKKDVHSSRIGSESPGSSNIHDSRPETSDHVVSRHPGPAPGDQCSTSLEAATRPEGMSKNQWKKLLKEQRRKEERKEWK